MDFKNVTGFFSKEKFVRFFDKDKITQILISAALGLLLWIVAVGNTNPEITRTYSNIPIIFLNNEALSSKELVISPVDTTVTLQLSGSSSQIAQIRTDEIRATIDLSSISTTGPYDAAINISGVPANITIYNKRPSHITLDVYQSITKPLNFTIENNGLPAIGYALMSTKPEATIVEVSGSAQYLNQPMTIKGTLHLTDRNDDFTANIALKAYDAEGYPIDYVELNPSAVSVEVQIGKSKEVPVLIETSGEVAIDYFCKSAIATPGKVTIAAKEDILEDISAIQLLDIDVTGLDKSFTVVGTPVIPSGVTILQIEEPLNVEVTIVKVETFEYGYDKFQILNTPPGLTSTILKSEDITVILVAEPGITFHKDDVKLSLDLKDLPAGTHQIDIKFELPSNVFIKELSQSRMTVVLKEL